MRLCSIHIMCSYQLLNIKYRLSCRVYKLYLLQSTLNHRFVRIAHWTDLPSNLENIQCKCKHYYIFYNYLGNFHNLEFPSFNLYLNILNHIHIFRNYHEYFLDTCSLYQIAQMLSCKHIIHLWLLAQLIYKCHNYPHLSKFGIGYHRPNIMH